MLIKLLAALFTCRLKNGPAILTLPGWIFRHRSYESERNSLQGIVSFARRKALLLVLLVVGSCRSEDLVLTHSVFS
jgi:hypothetical protein